MNILNPAEIAHLYKEPEESDDFFKWIEQGEVVPFLAAEGSEEHIIVYASLPFVFMHAVLVPIFQIDDETVGELLDWNLSASTCWGTVSSTDDVSIESPFANADGPILQSGEKIVFIRDFAGRQGGAPYYELAQKISQVLDIHHLEERDAWCRLNQFGDIDEVFKIHRISNLPDGRNGTIVTMRRELLGEYAGAGGFTLLRMFDFTRFKSEGFSGWRDDVSPQFIGDKATIFGRLSCHHGIGSYSRGIQVIDLAVPKSELLRKTWGDQGGQKQYVSFIADDWKHKCVGEFSCDPNKLANYFVQSDFPFAVSPAFFRPEVLSKYKADSEKYRIEYRTIHCRGAWSLEGFGVNDAGQVHAYLHDLGTLPYEEQLHWRQFNERPKAGLSQAVIDTDFHGKFSDEYDPLLSLKQKLDDVQRKNTGWWTLRGPNLLQRVQYPLSDSRDDWSNELLNLDQLLVEGLVEKWLRAKAISLGRTPDDRLRALKLLEECLCGAGFDADHARQILSPWHEVHNLRSELKGHATGSKPSEIERAKRKQHGNLIEHFRKLCRDCDDSLEKIVKAIV